MKLIYMGTPEIAVKPLKALIEAGHEVALVVTQPDKPSSRRGRRIEYSPVKKTAIENGIEVYQPERASDEQSETFLKSINADIIVVCAYGQILKKNILNLTQYGCINIHASLLPRLRGACPINRSIINGDSISGVTIMYMDEGLDTGDMMISQQVCITEHMTAGQLEDKLSEIGSVLIVEALDRINKGCAARIKQDDKQSTYAEKIAKDELYVSFEDTAFNVVNKIRGLEPHPAARAYLNGRLLKLFGACVCDFSCEEPCGTVVTDKKNIYVKCMDKCINIKYVQPAGKNIMTFEAFLNGIKDKNNMKFGGQ